MAEVRNRLALDIQVRTIFKIAAAFVLLCCLWQLYADFVPVIGFIASLITAAALAPSSRASRQGA